MKASLVKRSLHCLTITRILTLAFVFLAAGTVKSSAQVDTEPGPLRDDPEPESVVWRTTGLSLSEVPAYFAGAFQLPVGLWVDRIQPGIESPIAAAGTIITGIDGRTLTIAALAEHLRTQPESIYLELYDPLTETQTSATLSLLPDLAASDRKTLRAQSAHKGFGREQDEREALRWFLDAYNAGDLAAGNDIYVLLCNQNDPRCEDLGMTVLRASAQSGYSLAKCNLARTFFWGTHGQEFDPQKAAKILDSTGRETRVCSFGSQMIKAMDHGAVTSRYETVFVFEEDFSTNLRAEPADFCARLEKLAGTGASFALDHYLYMNEACGWQEPRVRAALRKLLDDGEYDRLIGSSTRNFDDKGLQWVDQGIARVSLGHQHDPPGDAKSYPAARTYGGRTTLAERAAKERRNLVEFPAEIVRTYLYDQSWTAQIRDRRRLLDIQEEYFENGAEAIKSPPNRRRSLYSKLEPILHWPETLPGFSHESLGEEDWDTLSEEWPDTSFDNVLRFELAFRGLWPGGLPRAWDHVYEEYRSEFGDTWSWPWSKNLTPEHEELRNRSQAWIRGVDWAPQSQARSVLVGPILFRDEILDQLSENATEKLSVSTQTMLMRGFQCLSGIPGSFSLEVGNQLLRKLQNQRIEVTASERSDPMNLGWVYPSDPDTVYFNQTNRELWAPYDADSEGAWLPSPYVGGVEMSSPWTLQKVLLHELIHSSGAYPHLSDGYEAAYSVGACCLELNLAACGYLTDPVPPVESPDGLAEIVPQRQTEALLIKKLLREQYEPGAAMDLLANLRYEPYSALRDLIAVDLGRLPSSQIDGIPLATKATANQLKSLLGNKTEAIDVVLGMQIEESTKTVILLFLLDQADNGVFHLTELDRVAAVSWIEEHPLQ